MKMKKINKRRLAIVFGILFGVQLLTSCAILSDPSFHQGFREGWNATAPEQYRY